MTDLKLPNTMPLPVAVALVQGGRVGLATRHSPWTDGKHDLFTAAQLTAYATAAVLAERERVRAICNEYEDARDDFDRAAEFFGDESNHKEVKRARKRILAAVKPYRAFLNGSDDDAR